MKVCLWFSKQTVHGDILLRDVPDNVVLLLINQTFPQSFNRPFFTEDILTCDSSKNTGVNHKMNDASVSASWYCHTTTKTINCAQLYLLRQVKTFAPERVCILVCKIMTNADQQLLILNVKELKHNVSELTVI